MQSVLGLHLRLRPGVIKILGVILVMAMQSFVSCNIDGESVLLVDDQIRLIIEDRRAGLGVTPKTTGLNAPQGCFNLIPAGGEIEITLTGSCKDSHAIRRGQRRLQVAFRRLPDASHIFEGHVDVVKVQRPETPR